jgi:hypothetical protein
MNSVRCAWCDRPFPPGSARPYESLGRRTIPPQEPEQVPGRWSPDRARPGRPGSREESAHGRASQCRCGGEHLRRRRCEQSRAGRGAAPGWGSLALSQRRGRHRRPARPAAAARSPRDGAGGDRWLGAARGSCPGARRAAARGRQSAPGARRGPRRPASWPRPTRSVRRSPRWSSGAANWWAC